MAYRFLLTLNTGAFVVLLTFLGNAKNSTAFELDLTKFKQAMFTFLLSISLVFLSMTVAYISAQLSLIGRSLPFGRNAVGHMVWLLVPVVLAFCVFAGGVATALIGFEAK